MAMSAMSRSWSDSGAPAFCTSTNASDKLKPWGPGGTAWPKPGSSIGEILRHSIGEILPVGHGVLGDCPAVRRRWASIQLQIRRWRRSIQLQISPGK